MLSEIVAIDTWLLPDDKGAALVALLSAIDGATSSLHIDLFGWTEPQITTAVIAAKQRGCRIVALLDYLQAAGHPELVQLHRLIGGGLTIGTGSDTDLVLGTSIHRQFNHDKVLVIDAASPAPIVFSGSTNFTDVALAENNQLDRIVSSARAQMFVEFITRNRAWVLSTEPAYQVLKVG